MDYAGMPEYGDRKNRCATCGFLALRAPGTNKIEEADAVAREGHIGWQYNRPDCAVMATNLYREVAGSRSKEEMRQLPQAQLWAEIKDVLEKERDGAHWFPWRPHFPAQWHLERRDMLQLEQSRREHELRLREMEAESRKSAEKIQADSLDIARALKEASERTERFTTRWTYAAFIVGALALFFVALTFLFPENGKDVGRMVMDWLIELRQ